MVRIERIVPMYPFSRDENAYERLINILSLYRPTLGQARQEELLEYILQNTDDPEQPKDLFINLSPFNKKYASIDWLLFITQDPQGMISLWVSVCQRTPVFIMQKQGFWHIGV